jgi:hypothetical protein
MKFHPSRKGAQTEPAAGTGPGYAAFAGSSEIAVGALDPVVRTARSWPSDARRPVRVFDLETGDEVPIDPIGPRESGVAPIPDDAPWPGRGPGRPKLGVVSKEVTLLPRHWAWLAAQSGSVSATLRRLIDEARHLHEERDAVRRAQDSAYRFISMMAGHEPTFEEAVRALFRGDGARFHAETAAWPPDVRDRSRDFAAGAFPPAGNR